VFALGVRFAVIADDFTGGLFVASHLERLGIPVVYVCNTDVLPALGDQEVVIVATRLRFMRPQDAVARLDELTQALDAVGTRRLFYKYCSTFDSTDEGNIGPCADFLLRKYGMRRLVFSPGYPDFRTYVHEGYLFYKDRLISESIKRFDPITPMNDPDMVRVLQRQTSARVGLLPHRVLHGGADLARRHVDQLLADGISYVLMDCVDNDDIRCGASIFREDRVTTGADALAIELAVQWREAESSFAASQRVAPVRGAGGEAVLIGSCSEITLAQRDHFAKSNPVLEIDICAGEESALVNDALEWARSVVNSDRALGFSVAGDPGSVVQAQSRLGVMGAARKAEAILARIAAALAKAGFRKFVVSGGETSGAVVEALAIQRMQVLPFDELGAGSCISLDERRISLFLKPGKLGAPDVFSAALAKMREP
jgi:uncharacterized protein YgbK (DUF1537 family)